MALGALDAGVGVAYSYPGTPATEILEALARNESVRARWTTNEKVALENGVGASLCGVRALVSMKHVGLNVAADPLFVLAYVGVKAGLVVVTADDPGIHSSQNEQDSRHYARAAKLPMLEPADSGEARRFAREAFTISERFGTPVLLRLTTRTAHSRSLAPAVSAVDCEVPAHGGFTPDPQSYVMIPTYARERHEQALRRIDDMAGFAEAWEGNELTLAGTDLGIITSGMAYQYCREVLPKASYLKLGMVHPLPRGMIRELAVHVERVIVVEELDPFLETEIRAMGIPAEGKSLLPSSGELNPDILAARLRGEEPGKTVPPMKVSERQPALCPGCPYMALVLALRDLDVVVAGDIGCYTLSSLPPLSVIDTTLCMGAGIAVAQGMEDAGEPEPHVAVIGDSTFCHAGMPALLNAVQNGYSTKVVILDNQTVAMTGLQPSPTSGRNSDGAPAPRLGIAALAVAMGVDRGNVVELRGNRIEELKQTLAEQFARSGVSVMVLREPCLLLPGLRKPTKRVTVSLARCTACGECLTVGCPALSRRGGVIVLEEALCTACGVCGQVCPADAIEEGEA